MKDRYSKLKTGLISATTCWPSHSVSLPTIESQYCHWPVSMTRADTVSSCKMKVPLSKSNRCSSANSLARVSPVWGGLFDGGAEVGSARATAILDFFLDEATSLAICAADSLEVGIGSVFLDLGLEKGPAAGIESS